MATTTDEFDFDRLEPQSRPVRFRGREYVLREPSEGAWAAYEGALTQGREFRDGKFAAFNARYSEAEAVLLSGCLFAVGPPETPVPVGTIQADWPHRAVDPLVAWLLAAVKPPEATAVPKSSAAGPDSSASPTS